MKPKYLILILLFLSACSSKTKENNDLNQKAEQHIESKKIIESDNLKEDEELEDEIIKTDSLDNDTTEVKIIENDIQIAFYTDKYWFEYNDSTSRSNDTINFELDLGNDVRGLNIKIEKSIYDSIQVFQQYENILSVMDEGKHCDLINWKKHRSTWEPIKIIEANKNYQIDTFEYTSNFVTITINELKKEILKSCGERWFELVKEKNNTNDYPFGIGTKTFYLKFILHNSEQNTMKEKIISFSLPMGC